MFEPVFGKREPRPYDYQEMTWGKFIRLREWAKKCAKEIGYPIYLVGSTLQKEVPRDFDISIIIPYNEYIERFGVPTEDNFGQILADAWHDYVKHYFDCAEILGEIGHVPLDLKICPDSWFVEKDKLLLGMP